MCIKVEALGLFVLLSLAIETCGIEETFFSASSPITVPRVAVLYMVDRFL